jgi:hypothetical protein
MSYTEDPLVAPHITPGRYVRRDGVVYDTWGRYFLDESLWQKRFAEGRSDRADHNFELGERIYEIDVPEPWHRVIARCERCGEERKVWHAVQMSELNREWCVDQSNEDDVTAVLAMALVGLPVLLLALYAVGNFFTDPKYAGYWWIR